jgi:hypothetical protein
MSDGELEAESPVAVGYFCDKCGYVGKGGPEHPGLGCPYLAIEIEPEEVAPECGYGRCDPKHPLHCCHLAIGVSESCGRKGSILRGWKCVFCPKESKARVLTPENRGPTI